MVVGVTMVVHTLLMVSDEGLGSLIMQVVVVVLVEVVGGWASRTLVEGMVVVVFMKVFGLLLW